MATVIVTAHDKIYDLLDANLSQNVYQCHIVPEIVLPGVTVEVESCSPIETDGAIYANEIVDNWKITLSICCHTAYAGRYLVDTKSLVDTVITLLRQNIDLSDGYRIMSVSCDGIQTEWSDSGTTGAEIAVVVHHVEGYTQS